MRLKILAVPGCPRAGTLARRLANVVCDPNAALLHWPVHTLEQAEMLGMRGSPTLLVNGADPFAAHGQAPSLSCRLYPDGKDGVPSEDQLRLALGAGALSGEGPGVPDAVPAITGKNLDANGGLDSCVSTELFAVVLWDGPIDWSPHRAAGPTCTGKDHGLCAADRPLRCDHIDLFGSVASAQSWAASHPHVLSRILSPHEAEHLGRDLFAQLLNEPLE